jgi:hypothetical protein
MVTVVRSRRRLLAATAAGLAVAAGTADAAGPAAHVAAHGVTLNMQAGVANATLVACGIRHHYTYYRPRRRISFNGSVSPSPPKPWRVKVKVKKCVHGRFVTVRQFHVSGNSRGQFDGSMRSPGRGFFFARAYYYGDRPASRSDKQYFRVR